MICWIVISKTVCRIFLLFVNQDLLIILWITTIFQNCKITKRLNISRTIYLKKNSAHCFENLSFFNILFQVSIGKLRLSREGGKICWKTSPPIMETPECWGSLATLTHPTPSRPPSVSTIAFLLTKLNHLSQNGHY